MGLFLEAAGPRHRRHDPRKNLLVEISVVMRAPSVWKRGLLWQRISDATVPCRLGFLEPAVFRCDVRGATWKFGHDQCFVARCHACTVTSCPAGHARPRSSSFGALAGGGVGRRSPQATELLGQPGDGGFRTS